MLSPVPIRVEIGGISPSPAHFLQSPGGWTLASPALGPSPGAYVVQEGRLSLEMFGLGAVDDARQRGHAEAFDLLSSIEPHKSALNGALQRAPSAAQLDGYAPMQAHAALNQVVQQSQGAEANVPLVDAIQQLPASLVAEVQTMMANVKRELGMPNFDSSRIEQQLRQVLTDGKSNYQLPQSEDSYPASAAEGGQPPLPLHKMLADKYGEMQADGRPAAEGEDGLMRRNKRPLSSLDNIEIQMPAKKRMESMKSLEERLETVQSRNMKLKETVNQAESKCKMAREENEQLWGAAAHIMAALSAALEARREAAYLYMQQQQDGNLAVPDSVPQQQQQVPNSMPRFTPCPTGLAGMFSPMGDDLFAACNMFISPLGLLTTLPPKDNPRNLFPENAENMTKTTMNGDVQRPEAALDM